MKENLSAETKRSYKIRINKLVAYGYDVESMTITKINKTYLQILEIERENNKWKGNSGAGHGYSDDGLNPITSK